MNWNLSPGKVLEICLWKKVLNLFFLFFLFCTTFKWSSNVSWGDLDLCSWIFFFFLQTTELCAKQDTYYREVIVELENRLKETIAGRDHVLALRWVHFVHAGCHSECYLTIFSGQWRLNQLLCNFEPGYSVCTIHLIVHNSY